MVVDHKNHEGLDNHRYTHLRGRRIGTASRTDRNRVQTLSSPGQVSGQLKYKGKTYRMGDYGDRLGCGS
jgi:hypothetical protein